MPSLHPGFEYDIFISYRQNDNRSGWVRQFVEDLREELGATLKDPLSIYFDENPHDGLQGTHNVDKSLEGKLKCIIFIPILSRTYCDTKGFAWNHEFLAFCRIANGDSLGLDVRLWNGNVASRILPVQIHDIDEKDQQLYREKTGGPVRSVDFIFRGAGVNRSLTPSDSRSENLNKTLYRDQINKAANAIEVLIRSVTSAKPELNQSPATARPTVEPNKQGLNWLWAELLRRNVFRAAVTYVIVALLSLQALALLTPLLSLGDWVILAMTKILIVGFPIAMILAWMFEISPQGLIQTTSPHSYSNPYPPSRRKPLTSPAMTLVLGLSLLLLAVYVLIFTKPTEEKPLVTIGVIPFENRSANSSDRYIAVTLTDEIINRLIVVSSLRVTADTRAYDERNVAAAGIIESARVLNVAYVLTGSVQRSGDSFVVRTRLFEATQSSYVWGKTFTLTPHELVSVQSDIVFAIAEKLNIHLNETEELRLQTRATDNPTAYDYYMQGRNLYLKYNREANDSAVIMFRRAIQIDQRYARAWAGLGDAYSQFYKFGYEQSWNDSSTAASMKAIELDSNLSDAYKSLANAYNAKRLYDKSLPFLLKALELNPRNESAVGNLGTNYFFRGDLPEALRLQKKSAEINPNKFVPYQLAGWIYSRLGDYTKAEQWLEESLKIDSTFAQTYELLAYVYIAQGRKDEALSLIPLLMTPPVSYKKLEKAGIIAQFCGDIDNAKKYYQESISKNSNFSMDPVAVSPIGLGQILLNEGNSVKAEVLLMHSLELNMNEIARGSQDDDPAFMISAVYAIMGKNQESLEWLQKAIDRHWLDYDQIALNPWFDKAKREPQYLRLMKALRKDLDLMRKKASQY